MAVTYITRIHFTIDKAIEYIKKDKVQILKEEALKKANDYLSNALEYIKKDKLLSDENLNIEIRKTLTSVINCSYDSASKQFKIIQDRYNKNQSGVGLSSGKKEILGYHVWQSFEENIDPHLANEIGQKLAMELYSDYQCVISTHSNTEHTHNHIVFNSVSIKDGKKFNINTANTKLLRQVSDRLCEEYGLHVLHHTKNMNLVKWVDKSGNTRFFEKTDRKSKIIQGEYAKKNDYRNTNAFKVSQQFQETNRAIIKNDIDSLIIYCKSLSELILKLQSIGYDVKNTNSKGYLLSYISFKAPGQLKFTRGKAETLGEEYTRESLIKRIDQNIIDRDLDKENNKDNKLIRLIEDDTAKLNKVIEQDYRQSKYGNGINKDDKFDITIYKNKRKKYLLDRINGNIETMHFINNKNIQSFDEINSTVKMLYQKRKELHIEFSKIRIMLKSMNEDVSLINNYIMLSKSIKNNKSNDNYVLFELAGEKDLLNNYHNILATRNLLSDVEQNKFIEKYNTFKKSFENLALESERLNKYIKAYDRAVYHINLADREAYNKYTDDIKEYYENKNSYRFLNKNKYPKDLANSNIDISNKNEKEEQDK